MAVLRVGVVLMGLASDVQFGGPVRWASRTKLREGRLPGDREARERVLQVGWIEVDDHNFGYADGVACGQDLALQLAEDHARSLLLWQAAGAALAAAQERLRLAETNGALQEGMLKEAAARAAQETKEPGEGQS